MSFKSALTKCETFLLKMLLFKEQEIRPPMLILPHFRLHLA